MIRTRQTSPILKEGMRPAPSTTWLGVGGPRLDYDRVRDRGLARRDGAAAGSHLLKLYRECFYEQVQAAGGTNASDIATAQVATRECE